MKVTTNSGTFGAKIKKIYSTTPNIFEYKKYLFLCKSFKYKDIGIVEKNNEGEIEVIYDFTPEWCPSTEIYNVHLNLNDWLETLLEKHNTNSLAVIFEKDSVLPIFDFEKRKELSVYWLRVTPGVNKGPLLVIGKDNDVISSNLFYMDHPGAFYNAVLAKLLLINNLDNLIYVKEVTSTAVGIKLMLDYIADEYMLEYSIFNSEIIEVKQLIESKITAKDVNLENLKIDEFEKIKETRINSAKKLNAKPVKLLSDIMKAKTLGGYVGEVLDDVDLKSKLFSRWPSLEISYMEGEAVNLAVYVTVGYSDFTVTTLAIQKILLSYLGIPFIKVVMSTTPDKVM